jgi:HPt (histidine-containing phosphotransfer) domain-containing protein
MKVQMGVHMTERQLLTPRADTYSVIAPVEAVMDTTVLTEFLQMVGPEGAQLLRSIAETYTVETPPLLTALGLALKRGDTIAATRLAHRLKGSCLSIGASRLAASCASVEDLCLSGSPPGQDVYYTLREQFAATSDALRMFVDELV